MTLRGWVRLVLVVAWCAAASASEPPTAGAAAEDPAQGVAALDGIRAQIVALEIEKALAAIEAFLAQPGWSEAQRVEALDLRAQAHVASDDIDAAEKDYRSILELRPDYAPNPELTSKKGMERFARIEAAMVGTIQLEIDPADAAVFVDGRPVTRTPAGTFKALAGGRRLTAERKGYDTAEVDVRAAAGTQTLLKLSMVPNARSVIARTDVPGVSVSLDGTPVGVTSSEGGASGGTATLLISDVPIGEHAVRLEKSCFAPETIQAMVRVDMADRSPDPLRIVTMRPARARIAVSGASYAAELKVDGAVVASLPLTEFTACPGRREIEVAAAGRVVWFGVLELEEADASVDLSPRPNCALVGPEWPRAWSDAAAAWSLRGRLDVPAADLSAPATWRTLPLPPGTDLAVGVVPRAGVAGEDRVFLYSPSLGVVEERPVPPVSGHRAWRDASIGASFVDGPAGVFVATVASGSPAGLAGVAPGDVIASVRGRKIVRAADLRSEIAETAPGSAIAIELVTPSADKRAVTIETVAGPRALEVVPEGESRIVRAAWGAADAAAGGADAAAALANFAILLERARRDDAALEAWRKVRALSGAQPALAARADYALGSALPSSASAEAASLFERAKSEAQAAGDPLLAAAAADRLADLGIAPH